MKRTVNVLMTALLAAVSVAVMSCFAMAAEKLQTQPAPRQTRQIQNKSVAPTPAASSASVNMVEVLKNQLKRCTEDAQELLGQNDKCTSETQQLREQIKALQLQNSLLQQKLNDTTHPGGSAVKAYCESPTVSRNTAGATNNCAATGYLCEPVSGLCRTSCAKSYDCASGYVCDIPFGHCIK